MITQQSTLKFGKPVAFLMMLLLVTLLAGLGCSEKSNPIPSPKESVEAKFSANPTSGTSPLDVTFTDQSVGKVTSWSWNFGDGNTSSDQNPSHNYDSPGDYTVTLTVSGKDASNTLKIDNLIKVGHGLPKSGFTGDRTSGDAPLLIRFTNNSTGSINSYLWNFGDGYTSSDANPTHTYQKPGTYTVSLTVTGPGGSDTKTRSSYITAKYEIIEERVTIGTLESFYPPKVGGDCDFMGHGPYVFASVKLSHSSSKIWAEVYMKAKETVSDWTEATGSKTYDNLYYAKSGYEILRISDSYTSTSYTDYNHDYDYKTTTLCNFQFMGDSNGSDICGREWHDTHVKVTIKAITVTLRRKY